MKKWFISTISILMVLLVCAASYVYAVDPFQQYHKPWFNLKPVYTTDLEPYINPGIAKNYDYDAVLVGSSMVENTRVSWLDSTFGLKTVKLSYEGGYPHNYKNILDVAFSRKDLKIKKVFYCIDIYKFEESDPECTYSPLPLYLYDKNPLNDVNYLLNKDIITKDAKDMIKATKDTTYNADIDNAYVWESQYKFSKESVLKNYIKPAKNNLSETEYNKNVEIQFSANIKPLIEKHPDTEFVFFFPPYSMMYWYTQMQSGKALPYLSAKSCLCDVLLKYGNVKIYDYQDIKSVVTNLDNYKDLTHYSSAVNKYIIGSIKSGEPRLTKENKAQHINNLLALIENYNPPV